MIVRINQFDVRQAEAMAHWPDGFGTLPNRCGSIRYPWPIDTRAFELLIRDVDEHEQTTQLAARQQQLRQMIAPALYALSAPHDIAVVRVDGPINSPDWSSALPYICDEIGCGRYAISPVRKWDVEPDLAIGSLRFALPPEGEARLAAMCNDPSVGLCGPVRLRAYAVPKAFVEMLLDIDDADDERWPQVLPQASVILSTTRGLESLHLMTRRWSAQEVKESLMAALRGVGSP